VNIKGGSGEYRALTELNPLDFVLVMLLPAMYLEFGFCAGRKGRTGGGGWVHPKGANSMAASGLGCRKALVGTG